MGVRRRKTTPGHREEVAITDHGETLQDKATLLTPWPWTWAARQWENKCPLFKLPGVWCFVRAPRAGWRTRGAACPLGRRAGSPLYARCPHSRSAHGNVRKDVRALLSLETPRSACVSICGHGWHGSGPREMLLNIGAKDDSVWGRGGCAPPPTRQTGKQEKIWVTGTFRGGKKTSNPKSSNPLSQAHWIWPILL